jgi:hypothetical protein
MRREVQGSKETDAPKLQQGDPKLLGYRHVGPMGQKMEAASYSETLVPMYLIIIIT